MKKKPAQEKLSKKSVKGRWLLPVLSGIVFFSILIFAFFQKKTDNSPDTSQITVQPTTVLPSENIALPAPDLKSSMSIEASLKARRTSRAFLDKSITLKQVSQMLWAAQGVTVDWGGRTAPSAKSTYPLNLYLVANKIDGLDSGEYQYIPGDRIPVHQLKTIKKGNFGESIYTGMNQNSFKDVPAIVVLTGNMNKMAQAFGGIAQDKNVYLEAGHAAQNMYLQAESLKLGMVTNSSFNDAVARNIVTIPEDETIIYLIPIGHPKE